MNKERQKTVQTSKPEVVTGAAALMRSLMREGVDTIFGYPGGGIMPTFDALYDAREELRHILVRHEQGAIHSAEGYARISGKTGVCLITSGPGATNLLTGLADAIMDSVPVVCFCGQMPSSLLGRDAFQEVDIIGASLPFTKWNYQIVRAEEIPEIVAKAFAIAKHGRPGPVLIDITKDAQVGTFEWREPEQWIPAETPEPLPVNIQKAADLINKAQRPYLLAGHGVLIANAESELITLAERADIPVACTLHGLSAVPTFHPLYVGMLGMHGNYGPSILTNDADVIVAVGMRFDDRVTGRTADYAPKAKIVHIDIDPSEVSKNVPAAVSLIGDAKKVLQSLLPLIKPSEHTSWRQRFAECRTKEEAKVIEPALHPTHGPIKMSEAINMLSNRTKGEAVIVADVGQHQMMAARYSRFNHTRSYITSGGLGTMGFGLPAAVGAKIATPSREVIAVIGDGGFQMTIQELGTIAQEKLPVKIIVLNNGYLGMVRQWQKLFFNGRYSFVEMKSPDFIGIARAYDIDGERVFDRSGLTAAFDHLLASKDAYLVEVRVEKEQNVFPMIEAGASVAEIRLE
jgi:acetolactate synthase I/II/III large subunit